MSRQDISKEQVETLTQNWNEIVKNNGGEVGKIEQWGVTNLEYPIKKNKRAYFTLMNIKADKKVINEMERQMRINNDVIRYISIKVEKHEEGPSIILKEKNNKEAGNGSYGGNSHHSHHASKTSVEDTKTIVEE